MVVFKTTVTKEVSWDMAHRLAKHEGLCRNLHGHTYKLQVTFECLGHMQNGMVADFGILSRVLKEVASEFDHNCILDAGQPSDIQLADKLNELGLRCKLLHHEPTAENMLVDIVDLIAQKMLQYDNISPKSAKLYETPTSYAEVTL